MVEFSNIMFGVRDAQITPLGTGDTPVTLSKTDVPRIRRVELNVVRDSAQLEGDDVTVAVQTFAKRMEGSIEAGGINLAVLAVLEGGTVGVPTGSGSARTITYSVTATDVENYFQLIAQAIGNDGGDVHLKVYKVKATSGPTFALEQGAYALLQCDIQAVYTAAGKLYDLIQHETVTAIV